MIPAPIRTLHYFKPETGMHMTEMRIYHGLLYFCNFVQVRWKKSFWNLFICNYSSLIHRFPPCLFSAPNIFFPDAYGTKTGTEKTAPGNGVNLWRQFLEHVSWALSR